MITIKADQTLCNILIVGKTGAGKSVLLNAMFGENLAKTNVGRPVTADIVRYDIDPEHRLTIFDTPGLRTYQETNEEIQQHISGLIKYLNRQKPNDHIHVVWYCISARSQRIEESEILWMKELSQQNIPIILVLTQSFKQADDEFLEYLKKQKLPVHDVVPILAFPYPIVEDIILPSHGLEHLVRSTVEVLPEDVRILFLTKLANKQLVKHFF